MGLPGETTVKIALIGDSQSEALWPRVQKAMPDAEFVLVRTQRGWAESHYRKEGKLPEQLAAAHPDLVVIELGGNNATLSAPTYQASVDWMLSAARQSGASRILYLGPAAATKEPYKSNKVWTRAFQQAYLPTQPGVTWVDSFPYTQTGHVDGVHFGGKTYDAWAPQIVTAIQTLPAPLSVVLQAGVSPGVVVSIVVLGTALTVWALRTWSRRNRTLP